MDTGPIIASRRAGASGDDADALAARVLMAEHRCYPLALRLVAGGKTRVIGDRVEIVNTGAPDDVSLNPDDGKA